MSSAVRPVVILLADDDEDDVVLIRDSFQRAKLMNTLLLVEDGAELMDYLKRRGAFSDPSLCPRPDIILLDLNMPRMDGREALKEIKEDPELKGIPRHHPHHLQNPRGHLPQLPGRSQLLHLQAGHLPKHVRGGGQAWGILVPDRQTAGLLNR